MMSLWLAVFGKSSNKVDRHGDSASIKLDDEPQLLRKRLSILRTRAAAASPRTESREQCVDRKAIEVDRRAVSSEEGEKRRSPSKGRPRLDFKPTSHRH